MRFIGASMEAEMFDNLDLMKKNVERLYKRDPHKISVSSEHYLWLAGWNSLISAIVQTAGGITDGSPTSRINILQRIRQMNKENAALAADLKRLWHFAGCPFDHCQTCIDDAKWIKGLEKRLGPPSAASVQAQHDAR